MVVLQHPRLLCTRYLAYPLNTSGPAVQNSLYEEGTAASSKRKSEFGDNEVTSTLQMHASQQIHRLCFIAFEPYILC